MSDTPDDLVGWMSQEAADGMRALSQEELARDPREVLPFRVFLDIMARIPLEQGTLLDVGCGVGSYAELVDIYCPHLVYFGCDISPYMVEIAGEDHGSHRFFIADAAELTGGASIILASSLIEPSPNWRHVLRHLLSLPFSWLILHRVRAWNDMAHPTTDRVYTTIYTSPSFEVTHNLPELERLIEEGGCIFSHRIPYQVEPKTTLYSFLVEKAE